MLDEVGVNACGRLGLTNKTLTGEKTMTVKNESTVKRYLRWHSEMAAMIDNLREFINSMPTPDDGEIAGIDYGYIGSIGRMHELLKEFSEVADEIDG